MFISGYMRNHYTETGKDEGPPDYRRRCSIRSTPGGNHFRFIGWFLTIKRRIASFGRTGKDKLGRRPTTRSSLSTVTRRRSLCAERRASDTGHQSYHRLPVTVSAHRVPGMVYPVPRTRHQSLSVALVLPVAKPLLEGYVNL